MHDKLKTLARRKRHSLKSIYQAAGKHPQDPWTMTEFKQVMLALFASRSRFNCPHCRKLV